MFSTAFSGMQESVLASFLLLELFGQEIRRDAYRSGQNSKHIHVASLCLGHRWQKKIETLNLLNLVEI